MSIKGMKNTIGRRILTVILTPFLIILVALTLFASNMIIQYFIDRAELELKGISEINAAQLEGRIDSVRTTTMLAAELIEKTDPEQAGARARVDECVTAMFVDNSVYNAWLAFEPNAFDGKDALHNSDYPGAPSGRFMRSYLIENGEIIVAPDMDERTIDDLSESPWYTVPRNTNSLYIDAANNLNENLYDYGLGGDPVYTLSIVSPLNRNGKVIGCVGADVIFDTMTFGIDNAKNAAVAVFYSDGRIFFSEDISYAESSLDTLGIESADLIKQVMAEGKSLFLNDNICPFQNERAFMYFHPVFREGMDSPLFLYVALPRAEVFRDLTPVILLVAGIALAVLIVWLLVLFYVSLKISRPIKALTLSADAVSQGELETEIAVFSESQGEIGMLSRSLHRMVEQFRVYIALQERLQEETSLRALVSEITANTSASSVYLELAAMLCGHFGIHRVKIVLYDCGKASIAAVYERGSVARNTDSYGDFIQHSQVISLISPDRKLVFLNSNGIKANNISFAGADTVALCLVPLRDNESLYGYIIYESNDKMKIFTSSTETALLYLAGILTEWIAGEKKKRILFEKSARAARAEGADSISGKTNECPKTATADTGGDLVSALKSIDGLYIDTALEAVGGLREILQRSVKLFAESAPKTVGKMDKYLGEDNFADFSIEVHGIKGALNNIGALGIGAKASLLEAAAKSGDIAYCRESYSLFRSELSSLCAALNDIIRNDRPVRAQIGDLRVLKNVLSESEQAAKSYDSIEALELMSSTDAFSYGAEIDGILQNIKHALELFDCETALSEMKRLGGKISGIS